MSKKGKKMLFEDLVAFQDKWATGISGRNVGPRQLTLLDILNRGTGQGQHPNEVRAAGPDIHGSEFMVEMLGDLFIAAQKIKEALKQVSRSPILDDRQSSKAELAKINKKMNMIQALVKSVGIDVDQFRVDKPMKSPGSPSGKDRLKKEKS